MLRCLLIASGCDITIDQPLAMGAAALYVKFSQRWKKWKAGGQISGLVPLT